MNKKVDVWKIFIRQQWETFFLAPPLIHLSFLSFPQIHYPPPSFLPSLGTQSFRSLLPNLHFFFPSNLLIVLIISSIHHSISLHPVSTLILYHDLEVSEPVLSAVGIMTISWVARLFIFVPNEVRFLSAIATVSMDTLHLDTRSHPVLNVLLWAVPSPVHCSLINSELSPFAVWTVQKCLEITTNLMASVQVYIKITDYSSNG